MDPHRLLNPEALPGTLWDAERQLLSLPPALASAYQTIVDRHGLRTIAEARDPKNPPVGGLTQEATDKHFAQAFDGSSARAQLALLDPEGRTVRASNSLVRSLSGNSVNLADAPCGAGAAALALLANIAELRRNDVLPRVPLDVHLIGAEPSSFARAYADEMLVELRDTLEQQAIFVVADFCDWDVTDVMSNTELIRRVMLATRAKRLLVIANFNAFLIKGGKFKAAKPQLAELLRFCSGPDSFAIWIEPDMNTATDAGGLFANLRDLLTSRWRVFAREDRDDDMPTPNATTSSRFRLPLHPTITARVGLAVMPIELIGSK